MVPQSFIQELLARVDVVDVVGHSVQLKKAGANFLGLCPFHGEKSPSFTVSPTKQFYHCFGCGAHGSAIGFMMEHAGLSYVEAIEDLARSVGLTVPHERGTAGSEGAARRDPDLLELMGQVARFYKQRLKDSARAIAYLKGRGVTGETAVRFGIGYAPDQWRGLEAAVADYESAGLTTGGLVIESEAEEGRKKRFDRFRDRIMFPIRNPRGQVIGFGGRVIDQGEPKYMNSPETPLFSKGRELYGLFEARDALRAENCAIVVEGYMDVVMLAQHRVGHAVATLGTATTSEHVRKLLRLVDRVVFAFDGDAAGRKAAWRALQACLPMAADTKRLDFLFLPPEHDPDSYVRAHGTQGFGALLNQALPLSEFLIRELSGRVDLESSEGRAHFLAEARPLLLALPAAALRMQLVHRVAEQGRVATAELAAYLKDNPQSAAGRPPYNGQPSDPDRRGEPGQFGPSGRRPLTPMRGQAKPPALMRRVRLLTAYHPALAHQPIDPEFLPEDLLAWLGALRQLPEGSTFAVVCESLRREQQDLVTELERDASTDAAIVADMGFEEAGADFTGALAQMRSKGIDQALAAESAKGGVSAADRERYQYLQTLRQRS